MPLIFVKDKKEAKTKRKHTRVKRKKLSICVKSNIFQSILSANVKPIFFRSVNLSMVYNIRMHIICLYAWNTFFRTGATKSGKIFTSRQQSSNNINQNEIRQAFNILINLEKNETIGWLEKDIVPFAVRHKCYCLNGLKELNGTAFYFFHFCIRYCTQYVHMWNRTYESYAACLFHCNYLKARQLFN